MEAKEEIGKIFGRVLNLLTINFPLAFATLIKTRIVKDPRTDTLCVKVVNDTPYLHYNSEFFKSLKQSERTFVLIHECFHVLLHHCTIRNSSDIKRAFLENLADDMAVNCLIKENDFIRCPVAKNEKGVEERMGVFPSTFDFVDFKSREAYIQLLEEKYPPSSFELSRVEGKENTYRVSGNESLEEKLKNMPYPIIIRPEESGIVDQMIRDLVEDVNRNSNKWGDVSSDVVETVKKAQIKPISWKQYLKFELGKFISVDQVYTMKRWDRHYGKPYFGKTTKYVKPVAVYFDTSGSVSSKDLGIFTAELESIARLLPVYFWNFDCAIQDPEKKEFFHRTSIDKINIKGRGGTCFHPVLEHARKNKFTQIVIFTDGCAEDIMDEEAIGLRILWVITKDGQTGGKPGKIVMIK